MAWRLLYDRFGMQQLLHQFRFWFELLCALLCYASHCFVLRCVALLCIGLPSIALRCVALLGIAALLHCFALCCLAKPCFALDCFAWLCICLDRFALIALDELSGADRWGVIEAKLKNSFQNHELYTNVFETPNPPQIEPPDQLSL